MQAATNAPLVLRCDRSYVFTMMGQQSGDSFVYNLCVVYNILTNLENVWNIHSC